MQRNLDNAYFRVNRDGKWLSVCWTDLTPAERGQVSVDRPIEWWQSLASILTDVVVDIGNQLDLFRTYPDESSQDEPVAEEGVNS